MNWSNGKQQNYTSVVPRNVNKAFMENSRPPKFGGSVHDKTFFISETILEISPSSKGSNNLLTIDTTDTIKTIKKDFEKHTFINETIWRTQDCPSPVTVY